MNRQLIAKICGSFYIIILFFFSCDIQINVLAFQIYKSFTRHMSCVAAVVQSVRAFISHAEGWLFKSRPRKTQVVKTGSDSSTVKRSAISVSVTGPRR